MVKMYRVSLSEAERLLLQKTVSSGTASARRLAHARVLLKSDEGPEGPGCIDTVIAEAVEISVSTVKRVRQRCVQEGMEAALRHRPPHVPKSCKLDGKQEAHLTALACSTPPEGRKRWTLRVLAARFAVLECGEVVSHELVRRTLGRNDLKPHLKQQWCIPDKDTLCQEVAAWEAARNALGASVNWRFTTETARIKLTHLYPTHPHS